MDDFSFRLTFEHANTTVTQRLDGDADIDEVVEAIDYALRGIGFDEKLIARAFGQYTPLTRENTDG